MCVRAQLCGRAGPRARTRRMARERRALLPGRRAAFSKCTPHTTVPQPVARRLTRPRAHGHPRYPVTSSQVLNHDRKQRRAARKNPKKRKALSKDPGVPNLCPFKQDFLKRVR